MLYLLISLPSYFSDILFDYLLSYDLLAFACLMKIATFGIEFDRFFSSENVIVVYDASVL